MAGPGRGLAAVVEARADLPWHATWLGRSVTVQVLCALCYPFSTGWAIAAALDSEQSNSYRKLSGEFSPFLH
jgi:hypothetical protein